MQQIVLKYKKNHKSFLKKGSLEYKRLHLLYGNYAIRAVESGRLSEKQLEAVRKTLKKILKKNALLYPLAVPNRSVTSKPAEVRMGKGKGVHKYYVCLIRKGMILYEIKINDLYFKKLQKAFDIVSKKIAIKIELVSYKV